MLNIYVGPKLKNMLPMIIINLVTPKGAAKLELLFNKPGLVVYIFDKVLTE